MHPFLQHDGPIPMVHRGAAGGGAGDLIENTLAAFQRAHILGFRYFETDVRTTADGVLVATHDASLRRVAGERIRVRDVTWKELAQIPVGGTPLPRFADLLNAFPDVWFNVDPKVDEAMEPLANVLREGDAVERVCVASFSDRRLRWIRVALGERACAAAGPRELSTAVAQVAKGQPIDLPGVDVLQVPHWMSRRVLQRAGRRTDLLAAAQRVGMPVHVWTVNDGSDMQDLLSRGVDGVISDQTDLLLDIFGRHGWRPHS
ncbi:MAG: glycerophosphodiester phosphodiesterase family protein [Actinomycetes bacterium]